MRPPAEAHVSITAADIPGVLVGGNTARRANNSAKARRMEMGLPKHPDTTLANRMRTALGKGTVKAITGKAARWAEDAALNGELDTESLLADSLPIAALNLESYTSRAEHYARAVVRGEVVAGVRIRQICARHLADLEMVRLGKSEYYYDPIAAGRACMFLECMPHVKGKWAKERELVTLEPWQALFVCMLFGWLRRDTGKRRYTVAMLFVGRKNAKSTLAAGIALLMLGYDGEEGPEVYCGATSEAQAEIVFDAGKAMLMKTPELVLLSGMVAFKSKVSCTFNGGVFTTMIGRPGDGANPHLAIVDEYHEHPTDEMVETMRTGMGSREQPILLITTTAGDDISLPCYDFYQEATKVLDGTAENDVLLPFIFEPDAEDAWDSDEAMAKANPNLGVSVFREHLVQMRQEALSDPRKINTYKRKHLNIWVNAGSPWVNSDALLRCANPKLRREDYAGYSAGIGIDLSSKNDLTARVTCVREGKKYLFFCDVYLPHLTVERPENEQYRAWQAKGWLHVTRGPIVDIGQMVEDTTKEAETQWRVQGVRFDPYNAQTIVPKLEEAGLMPVEVPQTVKYLSDPMKWLAALIDAAMVEYDGNPIFAWCFGNVEVQPDRNDNIFPRRNSRKAKIDVAVAAIMAFMAVYSGEADESEGIAAMISAGPISGG